MSPGSQVSAATTGDQAVDAETRGFILARYLNSAHQTPAERLAFLHSIKPPQVRVKETAKWLNEWQAAWERLGQWSD